MVLIQAAKETVLEVEADRTQNQSKPYSERVQTLLKRLKPVTNLQSNIKCSEKVSAEIGGDFFSEQISVRVNFALDVR